MTDHISSLPPPLIPAEIDLTNFPHMPLHVARLRDCEFTATASAEAFRAGVLLWCAAWHQVPAGSLPDDDRQLANLAGYGRDLDAWTRVKTDAMHGFARHNDGRHYHAFVVERAIDAWLSKLTAAWERECDRIRKENRRREESGIADKLPSRSVRSARGFPAAFRRKSGGQPEEIRHRTERRGEEQRGEWILCCGRGDEGFEVEAPHSAGGLAAQ